MNRLHRLSPILLLMSLLLLALTVTLQMMPRPGISATQEIVIHLIGFLSTGTALAAFALGFWLHRLQEELRLREEDIQVLRSLHTNLNEETETLKTQAELLTAMREMARVTNDNSAFREMLAKILDIMASVLECREIVLYLLDDKAEELRPRVFFNGVDTFFDQDIPESELQEYLVHEAYDDKRSYSFVDASVLYLSSPLLADYEAVGVVQIRVSLSGSHEDRSTIIADHQYRLEAISKHISLPIKKSYLFDEATVDVMTGLYTKRHFLNGLQKSFDVARAQGLPMSVIMCDIDHFKNINDSHGHQSGDLVLAAVARIVRDCVRGSDTAYRYGGEEIAILLLGSEGIKALEIAERIRSNIESYTFEGEQGQAIQVTLSLGCCAYRKDMDQPGELVSLADRALYHSKNTGRNQAHLYHLDDEEVFLDTDILIGDKKPKKAKKRRARPGKSQSPAKS